MTDVQNGLQLFESVSPDQLGAINLVLSCLSHGPREREPIHRALLMHSGVSGGLVNAGDCVRLAAGLGLLHETHGRIGLSSLGSDLLAAASWPPYNLLSEAQGGRLLDELLDQQHFATSLSSLLRKMRKRIDGSLELLPGSVLLRRDETQCLHALQSMRVVRYTAGVLVMATAVYETVVDVLGHVSRCLGGGASESP